MNVLRVQDIMMKEEKERMAVFNEISKNVPVPF